MPTRLASTPLPGPTVALAGEVLATHSASADGIGYLYMSPKGQWIVDRLSQAPGTGGPAPPDDAARIWIDSLPDLPADPPPEHSGQASYIAVRFRGKLEGPGQFGPAAETYQLTDPQLETLSVRDLSIPLLLSNSGLYENQVLRLHGQLLTSQSSTLLVERLGAGGIPASTALQAKIAGPIADTPLLEQLTSTANGTIHYGPVTIIGVWRIGMLYPLLITFG